MLLPWKQDPNRDLYCPVSLRVWKGPLKKEGGVAIPLVIIIGILQSRETMVTCSESRSVLSRAWSPGKVIWRIGCYPSSRSPLSTLLKWSNGKARANTTGSSNVAGVGRMTHAAFGTPAPDFASRLTHEAFSMTGYSHKAVQVWNQSFPSPRWAAFQGWWAPHTWPAPW